MIFVHCLNFHWLRDLANFFEVYLFLFNFQSFGVFIVFFSSFLCLLLFSPTPSLFITLSLSISLAFPIFAFNIITLHSFCLSSVILTQFLVVYIPPSSALFLHLSLFEIFSLCFSLCQLCVTSPSTSFRLPLFCLLALFLLPLQLSLSPSFCLSSYFLFHLFCVFLAAYLSRFLFVLFLWLQPSYSFSCVPSSPFPALLSFNSLRSSFALRFGSLFAI